MAEKREIYTYQAKWPIYGMNWSCKTHKPFRLAIGSFIEEYKNEVSVIQLDEKTGDFQHKGTFEHPYPCTKIMWSPDKSSNTPDLLATTGDYLRLWEIGEDDKIQMKNKNSVFCAPLTSFDWSDVDHSMVGTSSIDTTCTIWNIETHQAKTQLIAHDKEVYDIAFAAKSVDLFSSVGADGSVRMFDLRSLEHSTIIYEAPNEVPLLRLSWNKQDPNYLATFAMDSTKAVILDVRVPSLPVAELQGHQACINAITWAPHSSCHLCTAGDDNQALIWDLSNLPKPIEDPILAYSAEQEIDQMQWSVANPKWISIAFDRKAQILRI